MQNHSLKRFMLSLTLIFGVLLMPAFAQSNLLANPSFEQGGEFGQYRSTTGDPSFSTAAEWNGWITFTPRNADWQNVSVFAFPHTGQYKRTGSLSQDIGRSGGTFTASIFQTVYNIAEGTSLRASVFAYQENAESTGAKTRIGIGTGNNPQDGSVIWSPWMTAVNTWQQISVDATVRAGSVTVFIYFTQDTPNGPLGPNKVYMDDASLVVTGAGTPNAPIAGGATQDPAAPPPATATPVPAVAAFVVPQNSRPDGSIVHIVGTGDTLSSIAFAYDTTLTALREINNIRGGFLFVGQEIIVATAPPSSPTPPPSNTPAPSLIVTSTSSSPSSPSLGFVRPTSSASRTPVTGNAVVSSATSSSTPTVVVASATSAVTATNAPSEMTDIPTDAPTNTPQLPTATATVAVVAQTELTEESTVLPESPDSPSAPVQTGDQADPLRTTADICVLMFDDQNQNRLQNGGEGLLANGLIVLKQGTTDLMSYQTNGTTEPFCFENLQPNTYTIVATAPEGYGLTTPPSLVVNVQAATRFNIVIGAAEGVSVASVPTPNAQSVPTIEEVTPDGGLQVESLLGLFVIGFAGILLVGGVVVALIIRRIN